MTATGIADIDRAPQVAAAWLHRLRSDVGWGDSQQTYALLRGTLHALRDSLPPDEATAVAACLPLLIRGIYCEGWTPTLAPAHPRGCVAFLERVAANLPAGNDEGAELAAAAVIELVRRHVAAARGATVTHPPAERLH